jgi:pyruvate carboxylase subunit B
LIVSFEVDGREYNLQLNRSTDDIEYTFTGAFATSGNASVVQVSPQVFSVLIGTRSVSVRISETANGIEVWPGNKRLSLSVYDERDRASGKSKHITGGATAVRSQMPGKVIKLLVANGQQVKSGQGLVVVEAMKMQNELPAPKDGVVANVFARQGETVAAGETLIVIE